MSRDDQRGQLERWPSVCRVLVYPAGADSTEMARWLAPVQSVVTWSSTGDCVVTVRHGLGSLGPMSGAHGSVLVVGSVDLTVRGLTTSGVLDCSCTSGTSAWATRTLDVPGGATVVLPLGARRYQCAVVPTWVDRFGGPIPTADTQGVVPAEAVAVQCGVGAARLVLGW